MNFLWLGQRREERRLRQRWHGEETRIEAIVDDIQHGRDWTAQLLEKREPGDRNPNSEEEPIAIWRELPHIWTSSRAATSSMAAPRDLRGIPLRDVDLSGTEGLADASLDYATIEAVILEEASLVGCSLRNSMIAGASEFEDANLSFSSLENTVIRGASFRGSDFTGANIEGAEFEECDLRETMLRQVAFRPEGVFGFLGIGKRWTSIAGRYQQPPAFNRHSDIAIQRFVADEIFTSVFRDTHPVLARLWYLLSNFGRSPGRLRA